MSGSYGEDVTVDEALVRALLRDQHIDMADLPLEGVGAGWDNAIFRLGDTLSVRMPRRPSAGVSIINEQAWLPLLVEHLPLPIPVPVRIGKPGRAYRWNWSISRWLPGVPASETSPHPDQARLFGNFLRALHGLAPQDAPLNEHRGCALENRRRSYDTRLKQLRDADVDFAPQVEEAWHRGLAAPVSHTKCWLHGDLHARNVLVDDGRISAIIDWGDITSGDAATDLAGVWALFDSAEARRGALEAYGADPSQIARARAWAVSFGITLLVEGMAGDPGYAVMGSDTLRRVAQDVGAAH